MSTSRAPFRWSPRDAVYFGLIGIGQILIFFSNPKHFFMGDTLLWIGYRYHSFAEFLRGFITVDPTLWYRPLAQRTVVSVLYPLFGLNPIPYRVVSFILFFACTVAVFVVTERLTRSRRAAWLATLFFAPHVTHAFATYDSAFVPELAYTLFYVGSVIAWISWLRERKRSAWIASVVFLVGSLLSKETAVALPFTLAAVWIFSPGEKRPPIRSMLPHFAILACYLIVAVGYLHIRTVDLNQLISQPGKAGHPGYQLVLGKNVMDSTSIAFSWAFSISRGDAGQWPPARPWMVDALKVVRVLICVAALFALFTARRRFVLIGVAWFLITAGPTLPLLDHFLPYYLFGPMVGFSIAVGVALDCAFEWCARYSLPLAYALCTIVLGLVAFIDAGAARRAGETHSLLGGSAANAENGVNDIRAMYPDLPKGVTLVIFNEESPSMPWDQAFGMVFQLAFMDESIKAEYSSGGIAASVNDLNAGKAIAFKAAGGHLIDITPYVKQRPDLLLPRSTEVNYRLELSKSSVRAGGDSYVMTFPGLYKKEDVTLNVLRARDGIVEEPYSLKLDDRGQVEIPVGSETEPGTYTFVAVQRPGETGWVTVSGSIRVQ
jgi:hypothetical protein